MNPHYAQVAERAAHRCEYCQAPEAVFNFPFKIEHIIPPGFGGGGQSSNLALSCRSCNLFKRNHLEAIDPETGSKVPLFNPRKHVWEHHFEVDNASAALLGRTAIARSSINLLQMNRPAQLIARKHWMRLRLFPKL